MLNHRDYVLLGLKGLIFLLQRDEQAELHPTNTVRNVCEQVRNIAIGCRPVLQH